MRILSWFVAILMMAAVPALAEEPVAPASWEGKSVVSVEFQGLKRIEKEAIQQKILTAAGKPYSPETVRVDLKALFAMGYFEEADLMGEESAGGLKLVFRFKERPVISKIEFEGNEQLTDSDLRDVIKHKEWSIFDLNKVQEDVVRLQKHYEEKGYYLAKIKFEVKKSDNPDQIELTYQISDFEKIQIKRVTFLGNKVFSDEKLKGVLAETREGGFLSFATGSGNFKESSLKQDLQRLVYWYLDHGYIKFRHENPIVTVSDDKRWIYISIVVEEGEQYNLGKTSFSGDLLYTETELHADLQQKEGEHFSITQRNADIQKLTEMYQDLGYAFVNVVPKMDVKDDTKIVDIDYQFEKGNIVHFGEIRILGNNKTYDKVIRRELKIKEGELYSGSKLRISRENVERLGFFAPGEVAFNTVSPAGRKDVLDVEVTIKERSTGTVTLGAGFGSFNGFFFSAQIQEINLAGKGQSISLNAQYARGSNARSVNMGFVDPRAFDTQFSLGGDLYWMLQPIPFKYNTRKLGGNVRTGYPVFDYTHAFITYKNETLTVLDPPGDVNPADINADTGMLSSVVWSIVRDRRNNRMEVTAGNYQSFSFETAGLGGDKHFLKSVVNNRFYHRLVGDLVFRNNIELGHIFRVEDYPVPPSERFYMGGPQNLRGFMMSTVGPVIPKVRNDGKNNYTVNEPQGGETQVLMMTELEYPVIREVGLKAVMFFDVGNVYAHISEVAEKKVRADWGLGFRWFSPMGPLRFEWGFPFNAKKGEDSSQFQFFIGTPF